MKKTRKKISYWIKKLVYRLCDGSSTNEVVMTPKTLVIVKDDNIGDYILFRNFLPYLRSSEKFKDYKITLIGNVIWKSLAELEDSAYYDEMIWVDFKKISKNFFYRHRVMKGILSKGYEKLFYPVYSENRFSETFFIGKLKATSKSAAVNTKLRPTRSLIFNDLIEVTDEEKFEVYRYKETFENYLAIPPVAFKWRSITASNKSPFFTPPLTPYVVFFPGASAYLKRWHTDNFAEVARYVLKSTNYTIVIAGSGRDKKYAKKITEALHNDEQRERVVDYTGKTSLHELAELIENSTLLLTNDSVPLHMAARCNAKSICVLMGENYGRFAPYPSTLYTSGHCVFPPDVEEIIKGKEILFLDLPYNPDINAIAASRVVAIMAKLWHK